MANVFIFCALASEAKPLIHDWKLNKRNDSGPFGIYSHPDSNRVVVVTGLGKIAMASAIGYTMALFGPSEWPILLNFGIAGHAHHAIGSVYIVDKITDADTGRRFYPALPFSPPCLRSALMTCATPVTHYAEESLFDMEGSAFYEVASKFSSGEFIHCIKVISDNAQTSISHIDETKVQAWCSGQRPTLCTLIETLQALRASLPTLSQAMHAQISEAFHFSATNSAKLKKLLLRWQVLYPNEALAWQEAGCRNGKELLVWIENQLEGDFYL